jgi:hypothetical protein
MHARSALEKALCTCSVHVLEPDVSKGKQSLTAGVCAQHYGLVDNKEMQPLQELIDKFTASTPMPA